MVLTSSAGGGELAGADASRGVSRCGVTAVLERAAAGAERWPRPPWDGRDAASRRCAASVAPGAAPRRHWHSRAPGGSGDAGSGGVWRWMARAEHR